MLRRIGNQFAHDKGKANGLVRVEHKRPRALKVDTAIGCDVVKVTANVRQVIGEFDLLDLRAAVKPVVSAPDRHDPA
jgi:hypothetical protein